MANPDRVGQSSNDSAFPARSPVAIRRLMEKFIPRTFAYKHIPKSPPSPKSTRAPTTSTFKIFRNVPNLNSRLLDALDKHLPPHVLAPPDLVSAWNTSINNSKAFKTPYITTEADLSAGMLAYFWNYATLIMNSGSLDRRFQGEWEPCPSSSSGANDWLFRRADETVVAVTELKLWSVLTDSSTPPGSLQKLAKEAGKELGIRVLLSSERGKEVLIVVGEAGAQIKDMQAWANTIGQLYEQFVSFATDTLLLSSYEVLLRFERDRVHRHVLRVGCPIHREATMIGVGRGLRRAWTSQSLLCYLDPADLLFRPSPASMLGHEVPRVRTSV